MRRRLGALVALLLLVTAACADGPSPAGTATGTASSGSTQPDAGAGGELEEPLPEAGGKAQADLPGLLMGGDELVLVGRSWCGHASMQDPLPDGVTVTITGVDVETEGAALTGASCGDPRCGGVTLDADGASCWLAVQPPDPATEVVVVAFRATASCTGQQECDDFRAAVSLDRDWVMCHPSGAYDCDPTTDDRPTDQPTDQPTDVPSGQASP